MSVGNRYINFKEKTKKRYKKFIEIKDKFTFSIDINTIEEFTEYLDCEIEITHISCGNTEITTLDKWFENKNAYCRVKNIKDYAIYKCPKCFQEHKNIYFNERLKIKTNNKYELDDDYTDLKTPVKIKHLECGKSFPIIPSVILSSKNYKKCQHCESDKYKLNKFITNGEKNKLYEERLNNQYKIKSSFYYESDIVTVEHTCGHEFKRSVRTLLLKKDKLICPKCVGDIKLEEFKKELKEKYNGRFEILIKDDEVFKRSFKFDFIDNVNKKIFRVTPSYMISANKK